MDTHTYMYSYPEHKAGNDSVLNLLMKLKRSISEDIESIPTLIVH